MEVTVSYRYSNKVDSAKDAPWEGAEVSITDTVTDDTKDKTVEDLFKEVKLQVWAELGVAFNQDEDGLLKPQNVINTAAPKRQFTPRQNSGPKAAMDLRSKHPDFPTFEFNGKIFIDFRDGKLSGAVANSRHPDFKSIDNEESYWITNSDGEHTAFYQDIKAAGVLVGANV